MKETLLLCVTQCTKASRVLHSPAALRKGQPLIWGLSQGCSSTCRKCCSADLVIRANGEAQLVHLDGPRLRTKKMVAQTARVARAAVCVLCVFLMSAPAEAEVCIV